MTLTIFRLLAPRTLTSVARPNLMEMKVVLLELNVLSTLKDLDKLKVLTELQVLNKVDKLPAVPLLFTQVNLADNVALEVVLLELAVMAPVARPRLQSGDQVPFLLLLRLRGTLTLTRSA